MDKELKGLNERQKEAVLHQEGPLLVVAGAGAGKTLVITRRIARLIKNGVKPEQILAVTFTNKAANEMKSRISRPPMIGTFHSVCARILRANSRAAGLPRNFCILDKEDSLRLIKKSLKSLAINPKQFQPQKIQAVISGQKSKLVDWKRYSRQGGSDFFPKTLSLIWEKYQANLEKQKAVDFDDIILKTVFLFEEKPEILEKYQNRWRYILVDEYQDTNHCQYILIKLLAGKHGNICVVGDEDQSIYSFRGANFGNILNFEKDWPGSKIVMLEQNYRSTRKILRAANAVIGRNTMRKPKNLFSELAEGENLEIFGAQHEKEEADFVAQQCGQLTENDCRPGEIAVLYRANFQSRVLEESFLALNLPYQVVGTKFFERKEIKDIIAYLKAGLNPADILSLERIINEPTRGLGKASLLNHLASKKLPADKQQKIENFFKLLEKIEAAVLTRPLSKAILFAAQESGYLASFDPETEEGMMRIGNLKELAVLSVKYDRLPPPDGAEKFLEDVALMSEQDNLGASDRGKSGAVRLMTAHAAKGLEFPQVFVAGLEDGLFPFIKSYDFGPSEEEEERRLFYVALTRARQKLHLSFSLTRNFLGGRQINKPSRFLGEIPQELFKKNLEELPTTNYLET